MMEKDAIYHIAIDGPSASGKGTVARELSIRLGIPYLDTGAMYRGVAVYIYDKGIDYENQGAVAAELTNIRMAVDVKNGETRVMINGKDITGRLRENQISMMSSKTATYPEVRKMMREHQQDIAKTQSFILDGRDICSAVLPNARYKFFLTADLDTRARRRYNDLVRKGEKCTP